MLGLTLKQKKHPNYINIEEKNANITKAYSKIKEVLKIGKRYTVEYDWKDGGGHIQNMWLEKNIKWEDFVVIYDPQIDEIFRGFEEVRTILSEVKMKPSTMKYIGKIPNYIQILDIIDLEFNSDVVNYIMKKKEI